MIKETCIRRTQELVYNKNNKPARLNDHDYSKTTLGVSARPVGPLSLDYTFTEVEELVTVQILYGPANATVRTTVVHNMNIGWLLVFSF